MVSRVQLFVAPWTVATRLLCPWNFPGKNTGAGCHFLFQGIFPDPAMEPMSLASLTVIDSLPLASPEPALHRVRHGAGPRHPAGVGRPGGQRHPAEGVERLGAARGHPQHLQLPHPAVRQRLLHQQVRLLRAVLK